MLGNEYLFYKICFSCFPDIACFKTFKNKLLGILKTGRMLTKVHLMLSPSLANCGVLLRARSRWGWPLFTLVPSGTAQPSPTEPSLLHPTPSEVFEGVQFITCQVPSFFSPTTLTAHLPESLLRPRPPPNLPCYSPSCHLPSSPLLRLSSTFPPAQD